MPHICLRKLNISFVCNKELCKYLFCAQFHFSLNHGTVKSREIVCAILRKVSSFALFHWMGYILLQLSLIIIKKTEETNPEFRCNETDFSFKRIASSKSNKICISI